MSNNIFDLEQNIMQCWNLVDDVDMVRKHVGDDAFFEGMDPKHADKIENLLLGLHEVYQVKFENMFSEFESVCREFHQANNNNRDLVDEITKLKEKITTAEKQ